MTEPAQPYDDREATDTAYQHHVNAGKVAMSSTSMSPHP